MKFFVCLAILIATAAANPAGPNPNSASVNVQEANEKEAQPVQPVNGDLTRLRKSAYGGSSSGGYGGSSSGGYGGSSSGGYGGASSSSSIAAPPCPKNYIFSCQPNLAPIACSAPSSSYGSSGAYSAPVPTYVAPIQNGYGVPSFAFNNQYYQY